jgi:predicted Zn-dependent peptidase
MRPLASSALLLFALVSTAATGRADPAPSGPKPPKKPTAPTAPVAPVVQPAARVTPSAPATKPAAGTAPATKPPVTSGTSKPPAVKPSPKAEAKPVATAPKPPATNPEGVAQLHFDVKRTKLENGLRVVMLVDHASPTVAVDVVYDVGGRNEERGRSGFAHLFEHMMFQGSANVPRGEHFKLVTSHGGTLNGTTSEDRTNYFEMLPSGELALALWLEADRMKSLDISQKNFENQRAVVKEEYRMRVENAAYAPASIRLQELTYQGYWPYEHSAIGTMRDLDAAELGWVRAFHSSYYAPNNAVLSIAGDFDEAEALALVKKYFGDARPTTVPKLELPPIPEQTGPRTAVVEDAHAKLPALMMGWVGPPSDDPEHYALALAARLLGDGESSRLYRALVRERSLAIEVEAQTNDHRGPDMFEIVVKLATGAKIDQVQKLVDTQIADVARLGPSDEEMKKLRTRIQAQFLLGLQSNFARAQELAELELYRGDATLLNSELDKYLAVTKDDIKRVVGKYLTVNRRSVVEVKPGSSATGEKK